MRGLGGAAGSTGVANARRLLAAGALALVCAATLSVGNARPAQAFAINNILGAFDAASPQANPYSGCVAATMVGNGFVFGSLGVLAGTLATLWPNLSAPVAGACRNAVDTQQPQVCLVPGDTSVCPGVGADANRLWTTQVAALDSWDLFADGQGCCGGFARTSLSTTDPQNSPQGSITGTFTTPSYICTSRLSCPAPSPGLYSDCGPFSCGPVTWFKVDFVGRTPDVPGFPNGEVAWAGRIHAVDGFGHVVYDANGIYGNTYYGGGCGGPEPHECGLSYGFRWNCLDAGGNAANCADQSLTVTLTPLSGAQGGCGCAGGVPSLADEVQMVLNTDNLSWHPNAAVCGSPVVFNFGAPNDCMFWNDPRLGYLGKDGLATQLLDHRVGAPEAVMDVSSSSLLCLVLKDLGQPVPPPPVCQDVNGNPGPIIQPPRPPTAPPRYRPSVNGWGFLNNSFAAPPISQMLADYPGSAARTTLGNGQPTVLASNFYKDLWSPGFSGGLCWGMSAASASYYDAGQHKTLAADFGGFGSTFGAGPGSVQDEISKFHTRQFAAQGWIDEAGSYVMVPGPLANFSAYDRIRGAVGQKPMLVGLGPNPLLFVRDQKKWNRLFNVSHAVVAYETQDTFGFSRTIKIYDPDALGDDQARIEIDNIGGGLRLKHKDGNATYGGGGALGDPGDWVLVPLPDSAFGASGNDRWMLDVPGTQLLLGALYPDLAPGPSGPATPIYIAGTPVNAYAQSLPAGTGLSAKLTTTDARSYVDVISANHLAKAIETDSAPAGSTHNMAVDPAATSVHLDGAVVPEQYAIELGADFAPAYSRHLLINGLALTPGWSADLGTDASVSQLHLASSSPTGQMLNTTIEQIGQNAGIVQVTVLLPPAGSQGTVSIWDWNDLAHSLVWETTTSPNGSSSVLVLQDNPSQRRALITRTLASMQTIIESVGDRGVQNSLLVKLAHAQAQVDAGDYQGAVHSLGALGHEIDAQAGKKIPGGDAATLSGLDEQAVALLAAR